MSLPVIERVSTSILEGAYCCDEQPFKNNKGLTSDGFEYDKQIMPDRTLLGPFNPPNALGQIEFSNGNIYKCSISCASPHGIWLNGRPDESAISEEKSLDELWEL